MTSKSWREFPFILVQPDGLQRIRRNRFAFRNMRNG
jgi:hypothetical protein